MFTSIFVIVIIAFWIGVGVFITVGRHWLLSRLHRATAQRDAKGREIPLTPTGKLFVGNLPLDVVSVASIGRHAAPVHGIDRITLAPTIGLRLISFVGTALITWFAVANPGVYLPADPMLYLLGGAVLLYLMIYINTYSLSYDRDGFTTQGHFFQRTTTQWKDVAALQDNGHYLYVFRTYSGRNVDVQKYLTGISDFLAYAQDQIAYHDQGQHQLPAIDDLHSGGRFPM